MVYVPDPKDASKPLDTNIAKTAAAEFRAFKAYVQSMVTAATSTTSFTPSAGSKVFTISADKTFFVGQVVGAVSAADATFYMYGNVTAYVGTSLTINVTETSGASAKADWIISPSGIRGATGSQGAQGNQGVQGADGPVGPMPVFNSTSATSLSVAAGTKIFTLAGATDFVAGMHVLTYSSATPLSYMYGVVASYVGTTLTVTVNAIGVSGTHADWVIVTSGVPGQAATITVGAVTTLAAGQPATVTNVGDSASAIFDFGIPQGAAGGLQAANNLSDVANTSTALSNLGGAAKSANLSDLASAATARTNLGLGTSATMNTGTSGGVVPLLDAANTFSAPQLADYQTLSDAATVTITITKQRWVLTTAASRTLGAPTGGTSGMFYFLELNSGGYTPSWNTTFDFGTAGAPVGLTGKCGFDIYYDGSKYHISTRYVGGA